MHTHLLFQCAVAMWGQYALRARVLLSSDEIRDCQPQTLQGADLRASLAEAIGSQLFRLSFAFVAVVLVVQGGPAFRRRLASAQPELLLLARRVGIVVQLLTASCGQQTQVHR